MRSLCHSWATCWYHPTFAKVMNECNVVCLLTMRYYTVSQKYLKWGSKFHSLFSSAKILKIGLKVGTFFETQCIQLIPFVSYVAVELVVWQMYTVMCCVAAIQGWYNWVCDYNIRHGVNYTPDNCHCWGESRWKVSQPNCQWSNVRLLVFSHTLLFYLLLYDDIDDMVICTTP